MVPLARTLLDQVLTLRLTLTLTLTLMDEVPSNLYAEMHCCVSCGCEGRPNLLLQQISNPKPNPRYGCRGGYGYAGLGLGYRILSLTPTPTLTLT